MTKKVSGLQIRDRNFQLRVISVTLVAVMVKAAGSCLSLVNMSRGSVQYCLK